MSRWALVFFAQAIRISRNGETSVSQGCVAQLCILQYSMYVVLSFIKLKHNHHRQAGPLTAKKRPAAVAASADAARATAQAIDPSGADQPGEGLGNVASSASIVPQEPATLVAEEAAEMEARAIRFGLHLHARDPRDQRLAYVCAIAMARPQSRNGSTRNDSYGHIVFSSSFS